MLETGPMGDWTFKDLVDHLTAWRERTLQRLEAAAHGQPEPPAPWPADLDDNDDNAIDDINAWFQQQSADKLLGEVLTNRALPTRDWPRWCSNSPKQP